MANNRKLREYEVTLKVQVESYDAVELQEVTRNLLYRMREANPWRLLGAEVSRIEEV